MILNKSFGFPAPVASTAASAAAASAAAASAAAASAAAASAAAASAAAAVAATLAIAAVSSAHAEPSARAVGDPVHGKAVYEVCMGCHSLDEDDVGPKHRGVVGRLAGAVPGYAYSPALKSSGLTWDVANLDRWLTNPQALVPGAKMFFTLPNAQDRADVIAYLGEQH